MLCWFYSRIWYIYLFLLDAYQIIEEYDTRFGEAAEKMEEFVETIVQLLPPSPNQMQSEEGTATEQNEAPDGEKTETVPEVDSKV